MKKYIFIAVSLFIIIDTLQGAQKQAVIYFFESAVCPVCKQVKNDLPSIQKRYPNLKIISYEVLNKNNKVDAVNQKNISILNNMLSSIEKKKKGKPFVQKDQRIYPYINIKGIPHYVNKLSEHTTIKVEFGVPIFIIGDKALVGYNRIVLEQEIRNLLIIN